MVTLTHSRQARAGADLCREAGGLQRHGQPEVEPALEVVPVALRGWPMLPQVNDHVHQHIKEGEEARNRGEPQLVQRVQEGERVH